MSLAHLRMAARGLRIIAVAAVASLLGGCLHGGLPGLEEDVSRTVSVDIRDDGFSARSIPVQHGETVRFVVRNRTARAYDFTIGAPYKQKQRRRLLQSLYDAGMTGPHYYDLPDYRSFNAVFVPPGATRELVWWFNSSERLEFASNVPGHYERGTWGVFDFSGRRDPVVAERRRQERLASVLPVAKPQRLRRKVTTAPEKPDLPSDAKPEKAPSKEQTEPPEPAQPEVAEKTDTPLATEEPDASNADNAEEEDDRINGAVLDGEAELAPEQQAETPADEVAMAEESALEDDPDAASTNLRGERQEDPSKEAPAPDASDTPSGAPEDNLLE